MTKSSTPLSSAEVVIFSHSTEDEAKVRKAVLNILPPELGEEITFSPQTLMGHYKDKIISLRVELKSGVWAFAKHLIGHLSSVDRERLLEELDRRMDRSGNLYLRLNKQEAFLGYIELGESDPIWIKLKFRSTGRRVSIQSVKETLMSLFEMERGCKSL